MRRHPPTRTARDLTLQDIASIMAQADAGTDPVDIAVREGVTPSVVRQTIKKARATLAENAEMYASLHMDIVRDAMAIGDSKGLAVAAKATQWALERIADGEERVVDPIPRAGENKDTKPTEFKLGIIVGGVPHQNALPAAPTVNELPIDRNEQTEKDAVLAELAP